MVHSNRSGAWIGEAAAETVVVLAGLGLLGLTWMMNERWLITHFPPDYFPPYSWIEDGVHGLRLVLAVVGLGLILLVRRQAGSILRRTAAGPRLFLIGGTIVAVVLALVAAEFILQSSGWQSFKSQHEPLRVPDPVLGWIPKPLHTGYRVTGGRRIKYANDVFGYREPSQETKPDLARPTIVLAGESVMGGFGLNWDESPAAQISRMLKTQTVDLSVGGYSTDQIYLRLKRELPRFKQPVAVVFLFSPMLFRRNTKDFRPHLGPDLVLRPPANRSMLVRMAEWAIPYRSVEETDRAVATSRAILGSTVRLARSRGAVPIIVVPQYEPDNAAERVIRSRVLGNIDLPVLSVPLDSRWHLPGDWHPDAHAARVMAQAISDRLRLLAESRNDRLSSLSSRPIRIVSPIK